MYEGFKQLLSYFKRGGVFGGWGGVGDWVGVMRGGSFSTKSQIIVIFLHKKSIQPRKNRSFA